MRVLIVDDYTDAALTLADALTMLGHACRAVVAAEDALHAFDAFEPNVVIIEWASSLRTDSGVLRDMLEHVAARGLDVHFVVLSAEMLPDDFRYGRHVEVYLEKPVLAEKVDTLLRTLRPQRADPDAN